MPDMWMDVDAALAEVPVNIMPLIDDTDFKTREESVAYNAAGMDLVWNFVTTAGAMTQTAVTPTTGGIHDWTNQSNGMYSIEIPASGGTINNDAEGVGWFTGYATGILPWRGPTIGFRAAVVNNALIDGGDNLQVDMVEISGDSTAADNLESYCDGTTPQPVNATQIEGGDATDAINAACDASIETYNLDHLLSLACPGNIITGAVVDNSALAILAAIGGDISDYDDATDSQEAMGADLDQSLSVTESNIRGADNDTLKTLSDQLDAINVDATWDEVMDVNAPAACNTAREYMNLLAAVAAGKDAETGDWSARDLGDTKTRVQGTLTAAGKRSSVDVLDGT